MRKSNCLIEAIKAKIEHPIKTKLFILHTKKIPFHIMWEYEGKEYDFEGFGEEEGKLYPFLYNGLIYEHPKGWSKRFKVCSNFINQRIKNV